MSGFPIVDLILGMIFIYFFLSIISSSLVEIVLSFFKIRSKVLGQWLLTIFDKKVMQPDGTTLKFGQAIMDHCSITALSQRGSSTSFIDAKNFVSAFLEKICFDPNASDQLASLPQDLDKLIELIKSAKALDGTTILSTELQRTILMYAYDAKNDYSASVTNIVPGLPVKSEMQLFHKKLENWFDTSMDRIQGRMKTKYIRPLTFWVGTLLVLFLNADSVVLMQYLYSNPDARAAIAAQAVNTANDTTLRNSMAHFYDKGNDSIADDDIVNNIKKREHEVQKGVATLKEHIPLGWRINEKISEVTLTRIGGWLATVLAIMLGAPFWFDLLNKFSNIRGAGTKPPSSTDADKKEK